MNEISPIAEKNKEIPIKFAVKNKSILTSCNVKIIVRVENNLSGGTRYIEMMAKTFKKGEEEVFVNIKCKELGNVVITFEKYYIYDRLFIFKMRKGVKDSQNILVYPELNLINVEVSQYTRRFLADSEEYSQRENGDDPTETYQIREYREQDSIHDIHWKLSAKTDKLLVKERGKPESYAVFIWIDLCKNKNQEDRLLMMIELAASLSFSLVQETCNHKVAWYDLKNRKLILYSIKSIEGVYRMLNSLLVAKSYKENDEAKMQLKEKLEREHFSTVIQMYSDGKIMIGDNKFKIPIHKNEIEWDKVYFGV